MTRLVAVAHAAMICAAMAGTMAGAATLKPSSVSVVAPGGGAIGSPVTDDVYLDTIVFGGTLYSATNDSFAGAAQFEVLSGRSQINAEWGDTDTGSDGDDTPFAKAGFPNADQETTDPLIQDATLLNTFNSLSLSEITDGEGQAQTSFKMAFSQSLAFDDVGGNALPDILFFERGGNDVFDVSLIVGGTFETPLYSTALTIDSGNFEKAGFKINTLEINNAQDMYVGGFDLGAFGLAAGDSAFGFKLETNDGPDLGGFFLTAEDGTTFGPPLAPVPLPASLWLLLSGFGAMIALRRRSGATAA